MKDINSINDESTNNGLDLSVLSNASKNMPNTSDLQARILSATSNMQQELATSASNSVTSKLLSVIPMFNSKQVASFAVAASVVMAAVLWVPSVISPAGSGLDPITQNDSITDDAFLLADSLLVDLEFELALLSEDDLFFE